eukprot:snap_masked-scaffold_48-processed-gene-1.106-mRNA-1 protein AED:1.00 eAED:1.00 QI:0/0/0/0/1/1/4/0/77
MEFGPIMESCFVLLYVPSKHPDYNPCVFMGIKLYCIKHLTYRNENENKGVGILGTIILAIRVKTMNFATIAEITVNY